MAQEHINIGTTPNDGTGDTLRESQRKAEANFTELYNRTDSITPIQFLELRLFIKGNGNVADTLETGDYVHGLWDASTLAIFALYNGGTITDRDNYTLISTIEF